jgi:hypothetical protein
VTWHLVVPNGALKVTDENEALIDWLLVEKFLADALETSAPRSMVAPAAARNSLQIFMRESFRRDHNVEQGARYARRVEFVSRNPPFRRRDIAHVAEASGPRQMPPVARETPSVRVRRT